MKSLRGIAIAFLLLLTAAACGDDDAEVGSDDPTTTEETTTTSTAAASPETEDDDSDAAPDDGGDPSGLAETDCEQLASDAAQAHGDDSFVEAAGATYSVGSTLLLDDGRVSVTALVEPFDAVGYDRVKFLSECRDGEAVLLAAYVPSGDSFGLLFTTQDGEDAGDVPTQAP